MYGKFHDEDYDGLVIKLPNWFIGLNKLSGLVEELKTKLSSCEYSTQHPDHLNNLYELNEVLTKKELVANKKRDIEEKNIKRTKYLSDVHSGDIYELEWVKENQQLNYEHIRLSDGSSYDWDDYMTKNMNIKTAFNKEFQSKVSTWDALYYFASQNCPMLFNDMQYRNPDLLPINYSLYCTSSMGLGLSYQSLYVRTDWRQNKNGNWCYSLNRLIIFPDGCLGINKGGNFEDYIRLEGFERNGMTLIKSK